ncbi:MAG: hypothetical protein IJ576_08580 [Synergistaceae bacterium]|nr:hypothetical protein [Synergistaceae bacterium]MBR1604159.1 hypothetical protein [Synergistaceae bacterium]
MKNTNSSASTASTASTLRGFMRGFMLALLAGLVIFAAGGCGGSSHHNSNSNSGSDEMDEITASILEKIFEQDEDGSPMVFDYAPVTLSHDASAKPDANMHFVKYISPKDLNSNNEFITAQNLNKDSEYIIKYSHGGRALNDKSLGLRITAPDGREMILDFLGLSNVEVIEDVISDEPKGSSDLTPEELAKEIALDNAAAEVEDKTFYVDADFEVMPDENPCVILYRFKAPQSGKYEFAVSEQRLNESGDVVTEPDIEGIPFEFRLYGYEAAHSIFDNLDSLDIELTPEDIIDIQRIVLEDAEEFNDNGLPVNIELYDEAELEDEELDAKAAFMVFDMPGLYPPAAKKVEEKIEPKRTYSISNGKVIPADVIDNVQYDNLFEEGAGFYAHSGLRAVTDVVDDNAFSKSAIRKFMASKPGAGAVTEKLNVDVIATEAEHDRSAQLAGMSNFVLLRDAFNRSLRRDYARLGIDYTRIISVRYEMAENEPRAIDPNKVELLEEALDELKKNGGEAFTKKYGDYFVAGYTWGLRYDATIEITIDSAGAACKGTLDGISVEFTANNRVCEAVVEHVKTALENARINAVSERDTGKSSQDALDKMNQALTSLEDSRGVTINVTHGKHTGKGSEQSFSIRGFANSLADFIKSAKGVNRSKYEQLYVTLRRYREIKEAKPYINEALAVNADLFTAIRQLTEKIFKTRCYYNALMVIPAVNLKGGKGLQDSWEQEFEVNLITKVDTGLNYICADKSRVQSYYDKSDALYNKYKALAERYNFYREFVMIQKQDTGKSPSWDDSDYDIDKTYGAGRSFSSTYSKSKLVNEDFKAGGCRHHEHEEPDTSGPRGADFEGSFATKRVYSLVTGYKKTNHCKGRDVNGKTIGKKSYHWRYDGAASRRCEVFLDLKLIDMPDDKYPFAGLD